MVGANDFNLKVIEEFRANEGIVGGPFEGAPMLLLTTTGAKSGQLRTTPLVYLADGDRFVIFASAAGSDHHPGWYHNLVAHPEVTIEVGSDKLDVRAASAPEPERSELYERQVQLRPDFKKYQENTDRIIPVVILS